MASSSREFLTLDDFDFRGKTVFVRIDINSPINPATGEVMDYSRFNAHLETIRELEESKLILIAHQSRPGKDDFISLRGHAYHLSTMLKKPVKFVDQLFGSSVSETVEEMKPGEIAMLENSRFYSEEVVLDGVENAQMVESNIVRNLAPLIDYYVVDAFPAIHRDQVTLTGFKTVKPNVAGRLIEREILALDEFSKRSNGKKLAVLAGAKINESITVAKSFLENNTVGLILVGGVVGNAFLHAAGKPIGKKSMEFIQKNNRNHAQLFNMCKDLLSHYRNKIVLPEDLILSPSGRRVIAGDEIPGGELIGDIGLDTMVRFSEHIKGSGAIFLNGPMGIYEIEKFSVGTREIFSAIAKADALTIAGGGHTLSALEKMGLLSRIRHASTGGGALISYLSGENMPVIEALKESKKLFSGREHGK